MHILVLLSGFIIKNLISGSAHYINKLHFLEIFVTKAQKVFAFYEQKIFSIKKLFYSHKLGLFFHPVFEHSIHSLNIKRRDIA